MTEKIDTQGMSGPSQKGCKDNVFPKDADGNPIYPPFNPTPLPIFDTKERAELKEIMLEALKEFHNKPDLPDYRPYRLDELQE
tara:strand:- start:291 stop:539 length:249 start_codon:yes stop_codon:yes gene_type:complete